MIDNPIIIPILDILKQSKLSIGEYEIIQQLEQQGIQFPGANETYELALFKKHFMTMNALYQLQLELYEDGYFLSITSVKISLRPLNAKTETKILTDSAECKLREYYLDWSHFDKTQQEDVEALLNNFWKKYFASDQLAEALTTLGLDTNCIWEQVHTRYRQLANKHHPDKGGNHQRFIEIKQAFEILRRYYS